MRAKPRDGRLSFAVMKIGLSADSSCSPPEDSWFARLRSFTGILELCSMNESRETETLAKPARIPIVEGPMLQTSEHGRGRSSHLTRLYFYPQTESRYHISKQRCRERGQSENFQANRTASRKLLREDRNISVSLRYPFL